MGAAGCSRRICQRVLHSSGDLRRRAAMVAERGLDLVSDFKEVKMESSSVDQGTGLESGCEGDPKHRYNVEAASM